MAGDAELAAPLDERQAADEVQFRDDTVHNDPVRVAYLWVGTPAGANSGVLVQVAETFDKRSRLATDIIKGVILPQFVILPLAVLLVWFALARGIAPLNTLQQRIRRRESQDLSPIDEHDVPEEVAPLVRSINDLLARLDHTMGAQKHFLADAAHQMKTPLAGLRMQAELAQREIDAGGDPQSIKRSLKQIARSSQSAAHLVNQLLAMARAEDTEQARRPQEVPIVKLAREVVRDFVPRAMDKRIDLGYEGPDADPPAPRIVGQPVLVRELIRNLVDNALQYTPAGGTVTVRIDARPVRPGDGAAGGGHRPRHPRGRARAGVPAVLPRARHRRGRQRAGAGDRPRDRGQARRQRLDRRRARGAGGQRGGARHGVRGALPVPACRAGLIRSAPSAGCARSRSGTRAPTRA